MDISEKARHQILFLFAAAKFGVPAVWQYLKTSFISELNEAVWIKDQLTSFGVDDRTSHAVFGDVTADAAVARARAWARPSAGAS